MGLLPKRVMNFAYGMGAAVVIIGALFKLMHWPYASPMLIIGLVVEAAIFALSAFDHEEELDWTKAYPELVGGEPVNRGNGFAGNGQDQGLLSEKLDNLLREAKIDADLMNSLGSSIKNFEGAAKAIAPTVDSVASTKKYAEEMTLAASQLEALNGLYKTQLESASKNAEINKEVAANNLLLKDQMQNLTANLTSLNNVYGGMLSAMTNK
ncbi:gliding motility protein GldL [Flavobacterium agricola]|uniref:Gliding motility protein GldL n=1 Tax=Flavobacterium agricola TaxID=2870839 RepID=A0ABY6LYH7_9FLAO|nr:gliding motility protein GldL [Flavobacterium agricola]UYW00597.1 gliding motility protein GldL [Flavobacterium agricola]